ncbi:MAG: CopG family transcriptional regulator [Thioalkalivibrio sp.]|nr:MAG: CopG family transcriptional regulator [Thioalkalivibrio sp.]
MRVNARLDEAHTRKLDEICRRTGHSRTAVLRAAIDHYYAQQTQEPRQPAAILKQNAFIGCGEADSELARNYKRELTESLTEKVR